VSDGGEDVSDGGEDVSDGGEELEGSSVARRLANNDTAKMTSVMSDSAVELQSQSASILHPPSSILHLDSQPSMRNPREQKVQITSHVLVTVAHHHHHRPYTSTGGHFLLAYTGSTPMICTPARTATIVTMGGSVRPCGLHWCIVWSPLSIYRPG